MMMVLVVVCGAVRVCFTFLEVFLLSSFPLCGWAKVWGFPQRFTQRVSGSGFTLPPHCIVRFRGDAPRSVLFCFVLGDIFLSLLEVGMKILLFELLPEKAEDDDCGPSIYLFAERPVLV